LHSFRETNDPEADDGDWNRLYPHRRFHVKCSRETGDFFNDKFPTRSFDGATGADLVGMLRIYIWLSIPCLSPEMAALLPRPNEGGSFGVEGVGGGNNIRNAENLAVYFSQFSGESDSKKGSNDWSIQANTNFFTGNNGHTDLVQFVEQNWPNRYWPFGGWAGFCIWQVDVTTQTYPNKCVNTDQQGLSSSYQGGVYTWLSQSGGTNYLNGEFCNLNGSPHCWLVVDTDNQGLTGRWSDGAGTILGLGEASQANFNTPTALNTYVTVYGSDVFGGSAINEFLTDETNNLNPGTVSFHCSATGNPPYNFECDTVTPSTN